jgi:hypothetical protein
MNLIYNVCGIIFFLLAEFVTFRAVFKRHELGLASSLGTYLLLGLVAVPMMVYFSAMVQYSRGRLGAGEVATSSAGKYLAQLVSASYAVLAIIIYLLMSI